MIQALIIEDLKIAQRAALNIFSQLNCKAHIAPTAASALERLVLQHFDIVFIDIQLPDINGYELALTIRDIERRSHRLTLIAVTANSNEELASRSRSSGFDDFLIKPLSIESVRYILAKHLKIIINPDNRAA